MSPVPLHLRRTTAALAALVLSATAAVAMASPARAADEADVYAAPDGAGSDCSMSAPCSLDGARDAARALLPAMSGDVVVHLRGGTYRRTSTFTLGPLDSGRNGHRVVYRASPGERPVLSGGRQVSGFALVDSARGLQRADVPVGTTARQLWVNGVRAVRARSDGDPGGFRATGSGFTTADTSLLSWRNSSQVEVVRNRDWKHMRCPLTRIVAGGDGAELVVEPGCWAANSRPNNPGFPFNGAGLPGMDGVSWLENAYELLDRPGEWYLDSAAGHLYYLPRPGENLATAAVELPVLETIVDLSGTPGHLAPVDDTDPNATYTGAWGVDTGRTSGDFGAGVHYTAADNDAVEYRFSGVRLDVLGGRAPDQGDVDVYVDGVLDRTVSTYAPQRLAQQVVYSTAQLSAGPHTVRLVKRGGENLTIDGFVVVPTALQPVSDVTFDGVDVAYSGWAAPTTRGYVDNQAGVLWDAQGRSFKVPAAVQVHRGLRITITGAELAHLGAAAVELSDGTQDSSVVGNRITDTSGGGVSVGEVDDYYLTDPARMTTGNTVRDNAISRPGQDYQDTVAIWVGHARTTTLTRNWITDTPYSGISLGWGWGWASSCELQGRQGLSQCRRGTTYAGGNRITDNRITEVMQVLLDGGAIYTLGGQGGPDGVTASALSGNVVGRTNRSNNALYHDEGSSDWSTFGNVVHSSVGDTNWMGMWTPSIVDNTIFDNLTDNDRILNNGTNTPITNTTVVSGGAWPATAQAAARAAGPSGAYEWVRPRSVNDDDPSVAYSGSWGVSRARGFGDVGDDVHYTRANGDFATAEFTGTGVQLLGERNADQGEVEVLLDGVSQGRVDTSAPSRSARHTLWEVHGLAPGRHTLTVVKRSGEFATLDALLVDRTASDTAAGLSFVGDWRYSSGRGFGDLGDDVHYTTTHGDRVVARFVGTGADLVSETNGDGSLFTVSVDGGPPTTVDTRSDPRSTRQRVFTVDGLAEGPHTIVVTKTGGQYLVVDAFTYR